MSKKKATMTLKDFHGGSIPSDLPLPSAPGVTTRPVDRSGFERQTSWGNSVGRSDHRIRPASAGSNLDEKTPFLSHSSHIGRNFDEDERKPLDGVSGPRRTVADDNFRAPPNRMVENKIDYPSGARVGSSDSYHNAGGSGGSSYAGRAVEVHNPKFNNQANRSYGSNYPTMGGNSGQATTGSYPNAWGIRKETASIKEPELAAWSAPDAETKLAHASALEKVSSGRWNSNQNVHPPKDAAVFGNEGVFDYNTRNVKKTYNRLDVAGETDYEDDLVMKAERSLAVADGVRKDMPPTYERAKLSATRVASYERSPSFNSNGTEFQPALPSEPLERPKLKLLPRSKPLENPVSPSGHKQRYEQTSDNLDVEDGYAVHEVKNPVESAIVGSAIGERAPERPKLNLKPRSRPLEQNEGHSEVKRGTVFTEVRPRGMVVKTRGMEDDGSNYEVQSPLRVKEGTPKADTITHIPSARYNESIPTDPRIGKYPNNRRDHQIDGERSDTHRRNRQIDSWRNNRDAEKHRNQQQKQVQDRAPSPETWRKPIEHAKPASPDAPARLGKAASAVELAQAFSKSVSDPTVGDRRGIPSRTQVPFSRLMGPTPRPQINGY